MSIFPKFFFTIFGSSILAWLRDFVSRVTGDGGTLSDQGHTKEVYTDTDPYGPTLIQTCDSGGSTAQNLLRGSEDISGTYWSFVNVSSASSAVSNPFDGDGVSLVTETVTGTATAKGFYPTSPASIVTDLAYTVSAYVKKGSGVNAPDIIQLTHLPTGFGTNFYANYNISTGVVTKVGGGFADIEDVGGGWYRISLSAVAITTGNSGQPSIAFVNNNANATRFPTYTGTANSDIFVWGVQFVQGNEAGEYIKTTTAAIDSIGTLYSIIPSRDLLLYQYTGAAAAYSLRSLSAGTVYVVKVRRSGDDAESDFTASQVSDEALAAWVRAGGGTEDGFVTTWYDQSGNTNNATQATAANQPKIVSAGSLVTENGKAAIDFDGVNDYLAGSTAYDTQSTGTHFYVASSTGSNQRVIDTRGTGAVGAVQGWHHKFNNPTIDISILDSGTSAIQIVDITRTSQSLVSAELSLTQLKEYTNGVLEDTQTGSLTSFDSGNPLYIGANVNGADTQIFDGTIQEIVLYNSDQSANRTGIEGNINDYYNIYP